MKIFPSFLFMALIIGVVSPSRGQYCSKYRMPSFENQLVIDDFRSDSLDIEHTYIELDFTQFSSAFISGFAQLEIRSKVNGYNELRLDFEGLTVDSVVGANVSGFTHQGAKLNIALNPGMSAGEAGVVEVYYHGNPITDGSGWGGFYFQGGFAWNLGVGFQSDPHSYGRIWFPCFDNFIERSTFEYLITTEVDKRAACNGALIDEYLDTNGVNQFHWRLDQPIPSYLACVAIADYERVEDVYQSPLFGNDIPIELHAQSQDTAGMNASFIHLKDGIATFEEFYGPYRFNKVGYSMVPFNAGAMEHATNITYPIYAIGGNLTQESLMSHELAHMWWGDNTTCETDGDMWLNEGWASFSEYLFDEAVYGQEAYDDAVKEELKYMLQFGHIVEGEYRAVAGQPHELVYGDHVYKKGALVANSLRHYLGDEMFQSGIHAFMEEFEFQPISSDSLERYLSDYTGVSLVNFFRDWVYSGGYNVVVLDSFNSSFDEGDQRYHSTLHVQQKLKGRSDFHDDVQVYYTAYGENWQSETGTFKFSDQHGVHEISTTIEPVFIVLNEHYEMAWASTGDQRVIKSGASANFGNAFWTTSLESVNDSAMVRIDQIWSYPDPLKAWATKPYRLSTERYWKVSGLDLDHVELSATFFYDGRENSSTGRMDGFLLTGVSEDSLILLYRFDAKDDWEVYSDYEQNQLGFDNDAFGTIELNSIQEGEYVLAVLDSTVLGLDKAKSERTQVKLFPNPNNGNARLTMDGMDLPGVFHLYDMNGKMLLKQTLNASDTLIDLHSLGDGIYVYKMQDAEGKVLHESRVVIAK